MIYLIYVKWAVLFVMTFLMILLSIILSPLIALYSVVTKNPAPKIFAWFYTHDDDLDGNHPLYIPVPTNVFKLWWNRTCWICRNPAYGFAAKAVGFKTSDVVCETTVIKDGWVNKFYKKGKLVGFGYRKLNNERNIWIGWASPSHDGKHYMLKNKIK
jgi:hypothetical protein